MRKLVTVNNTSGDESSQRLMNQVQEALTSVHTEMRGIVIVPELEPGGWSLYAESPFSVQSDGPALYRTLGRILAEYVLDESRAGMIRKIIHRKYDACADEEKQRLEQYCMKILQEEMEAESEQSRQKQVNETAFHFQEFLEHNDRLHVDGFIRFRLRELYEDMVAVVEYATDEMMIDRQYQEFISILKYFVGSQEIKRPAVHIYHHQGSEFVVLDEQYRPIDTRSSERFVVETVDKEINLEDMIISTLITVSPRKVYIHTNEPEMQVIRTIRMIFEERAVLCT